MQQNNRPLLCSYFLLCIFKMTQENRGQTDSEYLKSNPLQKHIQGSWNTSSERLLIKGSFAVSPKMIRFFSPLRLLSSSCQISKRCFRLHKQPHVIPRNDAFVLRCCRQVLYLHLCAFQNMTESGMLHSLIRNLYISNKLSGRQLMFILH